MNGNGVKEEYEFTMEHPSSPTAITTTRNSGENRNGNNNHNEEEKDNNDHDEKSISHKVVIDGY